MTMDLIRAAAFPFVALAVVFCVTLLALAAAILAVVVDLFWHGLLGGRK